MSFLRTEIEETALETLTRRNAAAEISQSEFLNFVGENLWEDFRLKTINFTNSISGGYYHSGNVVFVSIGNIERIFSIDYKYLVDKVVMTKFGKARIKAVSGIYGELEYFEVDGIGWIDLSSQPEFVGHERISTESNVFEINQIVEGKGAGVFAILGFRKINGINCAQLKEVNPKNTAEFGVGEITLPLDRIRPAT